MKSVGEAETEKYGFWVGKSHWMAPAQQMACCCIHEKFMVKVTCSLKSLHYTNYIFFCNY